MGGPVSRQNREIDWRLSNPILPENLIRVNGAL
jgi:hypothetical protein